jgi:integrase
MSQKRWEVSDEMPDYAKEYLERSLQKKMAAQSIPSVAEDDRWETSVEPKTTTAKGTGWWSSHEYKRRSVIDQSHKSQGWIGWQKFNEYRLRLVQKTYKNDPMIYQAIWIACFLCGSRINEILRARPEMFSIEKSKKTGKEYYLVTGLLLEKDKRGDGIRFPFRFPRIEPKDSSIEPVSRILDEWIHNFKPTTENKGYLFPVSYAAVYKTFNNCLGAKFYYDNEGHPIRPSIDEARGIHPHQLRSWRASQLVEEYNLNLSELIGWFSWRRQDTAITYISLSPRHQEDMFE